MRDKDVGGARIATGLQQEDDEERKKDRKEAVACCKSPVYRHLYAFVTEITSSYHAGVGTVLYLRYGLPKGAEHEFAKVRVSHEPINAQILVFNQARPMLKDTTLP